MIPQPIIRQKPQEGRNTRLDGWILQDVRRSKMDSTGRAQEQAGLSPVITAELLVTTWTP